MSETEVTLPCRYDITKLIPPVLRKQAERGLTVAYRVNRPDYDRLPVDTFLIVAEPGTGGRLLRRVVRIVKPNDPRGHSSGALTPDKRLLYVCWRGGMAVKSLDQARMASYRYIVQPGDPGFDIIDAFKIVCDHRRGWAGRPVAVKPDLLYRALGVEPLPKAFDIEGEAANL